MRPGFCLSCFLLSSLSETLSLHSLHSSSAYTSSPFFLLHSALFSRLALRFLGGSSFSSRHSFLYNSTRGFHMLPGRAGSSSPPHTLCVSRVDEERLIFVLSLLSPSVFPSVKDFAPLETLRAFHVSGFSSSFCSEVDTRRPAFLKATSGGSTEREDFFRCSGPPSVASEEEGFSFPEVFKMPSRRSRSRSRSPRRDDASREEVSRAAPRRFFLLPFLSFLLFSFPQSCTQTFLASVWWSCMYGVRSEVTVLRALWYV